LVRLGDIFESDASAFGQVLASSRNTIQKSRIGFKSIIEPVVFGFKADEHARRLAMSCDHYLLLLGDPKQP
jgi:hypothetical protein